VAGHTRYKAAKFLGLQKVPCIVADDLTDEQVKAFRLADNKVSEAAEWDFDKLEEELAGLACFDVDMSEFGFDLNIGDDEEAPGGFKEFDENIETKHKCPRCGYEY
jgi:site-specific DNA-methyltransferase (adenine-specific)